MPLFESIVHASTHLQTDKGVCGERLKKRQQLLARTMFCGLTGDAFNASPALLE